MDRAVVPVLDERWYWTAGYDPKTPIRNLSKALRTAVEGFKAQLRKLQRIVEHMYPSTSTRRNMFTNISKYFKAFYAGDAKR